MNDKVQLSINEDVRARKTKVPWYKNWSSCCWTLVAITSVLLLLVAADVSLHLYFHFSADDLSGNRAVNCRNGTVVGLNSEANTPVSSSTTLPQSLTRTLTIGNCSDISDTAFQSAVNALVGNPFGPQPATFKLTECPTSSTPATKPTTSSTPTTKPTTSAAPEKTTTAAPKQVCVEVAPSP